MLEKIFKLETFLINHGFDSLPSGYLKVVDAISHVWLPEEILL